MEKHLEIFGLQIPLYAICILSGVWLAYFLGKRVAHKMGIDKDTILDGVIYCLPLAIIGARIYYVIFEWDYYGSRPIEIFKIWEGGLAIHGGIIVAAIFIIIYSKTKKLDMWKIFDIVFPVFMLAQMLGRWGNFYNCEAHGDIMPGWLVDLELAIFPDALIERTYLEYGSYYHPTFLYEGLLNLLGYFIVTGIRKFSFFKKGDSLPFYMVWYGIIRFFIEAMRTDSLYQTYFGREFKQNQVISVVLIVGGIILFFVKRFALKVKEPYNHTVTEDYETLPTLNEMTIEPKANLIEYYKDLFKKKKKG